MQQWQRLMSELRPMSDAPWATAVGGSGREALYNAPPFGALRDDPWSAVTMGRFAPRLKPLLFDIPGGAGRLMHPWVRACACL